MYLAPHHAAWLSAHPNRTAEWLKSRVADGFDVHHADGNPQNNDPQNLMLIEHDDHMRIHDAPLFSRLRNLPLTKQPRRKALTKKAKIRKENRRISTEAESARKLAKDVARKEHDARVARVGEITAKLGQDQQSALNR